MLALTQKSLLRALHVFAYLISWLCLANRAVPSNWLVLGILFVALIPVAFLYGWLTSPRESAGVAGLIFPVPKPAAVSIGVAIAILVYLKYDATIDSALFSTVR